MKNDMPRDWYRRLERLEEDVRALLAPIPVRALRLRLDLPGSSVPVPTLRGVLGRALHDGWPQVYETVFAPCGEDGRSTPLFVLRRAPPDDSRLPGVELVLFGAAVQRKTEMRAAWDRAGELGLGQSRRRFTVAKWTELNARGEPAGPEESRWRLDEVDWPLTGDPAYTPCRLLFPEPLRILRRGKLVTRPRLADLVVAAARRIRALLPQEWQARARDYQEEILAAVAPVPQCPWEGRKDRVRRMSGSQERRIELRGVSGHLDLPKGPGPLRTLLSATQWLHLGKGTVLGMGRLRITNPW